MHGARDQMYSIFVGTVISLNKLYLYKTVMCLVFDSDAFDCWIYQYLIAWINLINASTSMNTYD